MQINRNNYGAFFLDYAEKTLSQEGRQDLARFLQENPDLQDEFFAFENITLSPDFKIVYEPKSKLKKLAIFPCGSIHQENYEEWIIASLEGDLSKDELIEYEEFKAINPDVEKEIDAYKRTFLKPKSEIFFPDKSRLKRKLEIPLTRKIFWYAASMAAVLLITFGVFRLLSEIVTGSKNQQAVINETPFKPINIPAIKHSDSGDNTFSVVQQSKQSQQKNINTAMIAINQSVLHVQQEMHIRSEHAINSIPVIVYEKPLQIAADINFVDIYSTRDELSAIFDDMILRDAIEATTINSGNKKNAIGRVLANLGNRIINSGSQNTQDPAMINGIAARSKQAMLEFADGLPIYRSIKKDDQDRIVFAIGDNMSIGLSRNNTRSGTFPANRE